MMYEVRNAVSDDLNDIIRIEQTFGAEAFSKRTLRQQLKNTIVLKDEEVLGYCIFFKFKNSARIYSIAVDEKHRRKGLGKILLKEVENRCQEMGIAKLTLEVAIDNIAAQHVYSLMGYTKIKDLSDYYDLGRHAIKLSKNLK
jgi:ribosomal protein S18 acetylase RimI-like enzyme